MALKKSPASTQASEEKPQSAVQFEADDNESALGAPFDTDNGTINSNTDNDTATNTQAPERGATPEKTMLNEQTPTHSTDVAEVRNTSVSTNVNTNFSQQVSEMKGALDMSYGNFRVFKASNGAIVEVGDNGEDLGRFVQVRMMAWDKHWEVSPGTNDKKSKDYLAFSDDGVHIDRVVGEELQKYVGSTIEQYLKYLREDEGFDNASKREFVDVACVALSNDAGVDLEGDIIQVTLPPTSIPAFSKYQSGLAGKARALEMGIPGIKLPEDPFTFFFVVEKASKGDNKWTKLKIESKLPTKL